MDAQIAIGALLAAAVVLALGVWALRAWRVRPPLTPQAPPAALDTLSSWQPQATRLLTQAEREAFDLLREAFPRHIVMAQVPLARFLRVPTRYSYKEWLRRIGHQCADLVLCDASTQVVAVVAVRAAKPQNERAAKRHARLARILKAAEIPLHVWVESALPSSAGVRRQFGIEELTPTVHRQPAEMALAEGESAHQGVAHPRGLDARTRVPVAPDEVIEMREPPNSTWFDEFDSRATPLDETRRPQGNP